MEDFDEGEVIKLVQSALAKEGEGALEPKQSIPLGMGQGDLIERLFKRLSDYMNKADAQMVFDDLRTELFSGIETPDLKTIHTITKNCRKCGEAAIPDQNLPQWNLSDPDCVFVSDIPFYAKESMEFFVGSLVSAGFSSTRVALTYLNRCPPAQKNYEAQHIRNCASYLYTELQILRPKLIVTMGLLPLASLLGTNSKLKDTRGTVMWLGPWAIMPTYSPAYAIKAGGSISNNFKSDIVSAYNFCYGV